MYTLVNVSNVLPVLSIAHNPGEQAPVIINLYPDWEKTGECHISYVELEELVETCRLLAFIVDAAADEVYAAELERARRELGDMPDIPF